MRQHSERTGHFLSLDTLHFHVYCSLCQDFVYDGDLLRISEEERLHSISSSHRRCIGIDKALQKSRKRAMFRPWHPRSAEEAETLSKVHNWIDTKTTFGLDPRKDLMIQGLVCGDFRILATPALSTASFRCALATLNHIFHRDSISRKGVLPQPAPSQLLSFRTPPA
jgi:hypothetical protein